MSPKRHEGGKPLLGGKLEGTFAHGTRVAGDPAGLLNKCVQIPLAGPGGPARPGAGALWSTAPPRDMGNRAVCIILGKAADVSTAFGHARRVASLSKRYL